MPFLQFLRENAPFLAAGVLLTFSSSFGQIFFIAVFAGHIREEFGLSHGTWGALFAVATGASAATMIWSGALTDRYRVRRLGALVLCGIAASCLAMALAHGLAVLCLAIFGLRFFGQGMAQHTAYVAMSRWFVATRGRAISITAMGYSLGEATLPLLFVALQAVLPWRVLWLVAAITALAALPAIVRLLTLERTPQQIAAETGGVGMDGRQWTRSEVIRERLFWLMLPAQMSVPLFLPALFFHQVHLAQAKGWSHIELVSLFPLYTAVAITTTLAAGWAVDRWGSARLLPFYLLPMAAGFALLSVVESRFGGAVALCLVALTPGAGAALGSAFWAEFYGTRHVGSIRGATVSIMVFCTAIGPALTGDLIDRGLSFPAQAPFIALYLLATSVLAAYGIAGARRRLPPRGTGPAG